MYITHYINLKTNNSIVDIFQKFVVVVGLVKKELRMVKCHC